MTYQTTHEFTPAQLEGLFLSVDWSSGHYPEKLAQAMRGFSTVISAWEDGQLIGLLCAMDDGAMNAYIHYLLVRPEFQGRGVGRRLTELAKETYADYLRVAVIAYNAGLSFYQNCGFTPARDATPMFITSLWT